MTATMHTGATGDRQRLELGAFARDNVEHVLVASRDHDAPWQLLDATRDATTVIETFYPDEQLEAVRAVASMYIEDMNAPPAQGDV